MVPESHPLRRSMLALAVFVSAMTVASYVLGSAKLLEQNATFGKYLMAIHTPAELVALWFERNPHHISSSAWILGCFVQWSVIGSLALLIVFLSRRLVVTLFCTKPN